MAKESYKRKISAILGAIACFALFFGCARRTGLVIKDTLLEGIPKGYVEFYYLKSEGNPPAATNIYLIEKDKALLEGKIESSLFSEDRVAFRLAKIFMKII